MSAAKTIVKIIEDLITPAVEKGLGRGATKQSKAAVTKAANKAGVSDKQFKGIAKKILKDKVKPGRKPKPKSKPKTSKPKRTPAENRELRKLIAQQKKDDAPVDTVKEPTRIKLTAGGSYALPSKVKLPEGKISKARKRQLIETGQAKQVRGKKGKSKLVETGKYAPPASQIAEEMGIGASRGVRPTEKELRDVGGFEIKKTGGKVRGVGAATRGFGKARYSYKNI